MEYFESIQPIERIYCTGEEPVVVECSDLKTRVCKYSRSSGSAFKMACEIIGATMAEAWNINAPKCDFINIKPFHVPTSLSTSWFEKPCIGTVMINGVVDITQSSIANVKQTEKNLESLLKIALFDFWLANEDRNSNNANLLYDIKNETIIPIDFGCIFNTATFEFPLSQLTSTDTILYSELFENLTKNFSADYVLKKTINLVNYYNISLSKSKCLVPIILNKLPYKWNISQSIIVNKLNELFDNQWVDSIWNNFIECVKDNLCDE